MAEHVVSPVKKDSSSLFPTLRDPTDVEGIIEEEKQKTYANLHFRERQYQVDSAFYHELTINAKRAYTGEHMRAVYTDNGRGQFFNVENLALKYYGQAEGWNGLHVENNLMRYYLGILLWDEIFFDRVPHVFQTPYQFGPLDFEYPEFYESRKDVIEAKLEVIARMDCLKLRDYFE